MLSVQQIKVMTAFGYERTEYPIGVGGCGKQAVDITWCLNPDACNAINDSNSLLGTY